jgi:hypothetical protein
MADFQFFGSNPATRPAQGPKGGLWSRELPRSWQEALSLQRSAEADRRETAAPEPASESERPVTGSS